jgi:hypothetical protein
MRGFTITKPDPIHSDLWRVTCRACGQSRDTYTHERAVLLGEGHTLVCVTR